MRKGGCCCNVDFPLFIDVVVGWCIVGVGC